MSCQLTAVLVFAASAPRNFIEKLPRRDLRWRRSEMMKSICTLIATTAVLFGSGADAQYTDGMIKIGVLTDMSGLYSDTSGAGSVVAARMAVQDFDAANRGMKVEANGGRVLGKVRHPLNTNDFSSFLLQAQSSRAKVIGLANAGGDTINSIKQAAEFGITKRGQSLAGLLVFASDVAALGLPAAQGLLLTETWYWDMNDSNRTWTKRWKAERGDKFPTMIHAGVYSSTMHYLKAVERLGSDGDGKAVVAKMKELPTDDRLFGKGVVRVDGRKMHDAYLFEVKEPAESKYPGDFYKTRATIPAAEAFRSLKDGGCPLVNG
jgi:Periplasmic binding protein